jgi:hypothetical protein
VIRAKLTSPRTSIIDMPPIDMVWKPPITTI